MSIYLDFFLIFFSENSDNEQKEDWRQIISQLNRSSCSNEAYFESASKRQLKRTPNKSVKKKDTPKEADPVSNFFYILLKICFILT